MPFKKVVILFCALMIAACASAPPTLVERKSTADQLAAAQGWQSLKIESGIFMLTAYTPVRYSPNEQLSVYIEGDGLAWISSEQPSADPTPIRPTGLQLALAQPAGNAAYLGRPCQYGGAAQAPCGKKYWTHARFSSEVISASNEAIDNLKKRFGAKRLTLVGYSGGGAVAALVAAQRNDVERLITIAGNLDHRTWTEQHHISPLTGSLNPADFSAQLSKIPQWHFVGGNDRNIPVDIARSYTKDFPKSAQSNIRVMPGYDHQCCWADHWSTLWREIPAQ